jgi:hypothetical protein
MCMLFGCGAASTPPPELLMFGLAGWREAARGDAVARLARSNSGR